MSFFLIGNRVYLTPLHEVLQMISVHYYYYTIDDHLFQMRWTQVKSCVSLWELLRVAVIDLTRTTFINVAAP